MYGGPGTGGVVPTLGITAAKVSRGAPHPGYHRPRRGPGCGYHIDQARGLARGGNTLYPKIPVPEIGYRLERSGTHRSGPSRSDVWRTNLAYRINYTSDGMDSKSQSHTQSNQKVPVSPRAKYPGYHKEGGPGVRRTPGITTAELVPRCVDHSDARGRNDPPPCPPPYIPHEGTSTYCFQQIKSSLVYTKTTDTPGITTAELVPRCVDHSEARGRNDPPPARATVHPTQPQTMRVLRGRSIQRGTVTSPSSE